MKQFERKQLREAISYALEGGQALHVWQPIGDWPNAPTVFKKNKQAWSHLFDQDRDRLIATAKKFGVRVILVHHEGTERQHIDLCGRPLGRAILRCSSGS